MRIEQAAKVVVVLSSVAFAAASATAPKTHAVKKTETVAHSFEQTWTALIDIFADRNWSIDNLDKASGIITTDWMSLDAEDARFADCGGAGMASERSTQVRFNVRVKGDEVSSTVSVNTKFRQERYFDGRTFTVDCTSRGIVEVEIQRAIDGVASRAVKRKEPKSKSAVASARRGFYCAKNDTAGFCVRDKAECVRTRDVSLAALSDLSHCLLTEKAWCFGDRCFPTTETCDEARGRADVGAEHACAEVE